MSDESTKHLQFSFKALSPRGFEHIVVWRDDRGDQEGGHDAIERLIAAMVALEETLESKGYKPTYSGGYIPNPSSSSKGSRSNGQAPRSTSNEYPDHEGVATGTVTMISVKKERETGIRLEIKVDNRQKPVYALGTTEENVETYVKPLFDPDVFTDDFTWEMLLEPKRSYDQEDFGHIKAITGKGKYWDVLRVYREKD